MARRKRNAKTKVYEKDEDSYDIEIEGYDATDVDDYNAIGYGNGVEIETREGDFILFEDAEEAGKAAREYYADMAAEDPDEFANLVGTDTLVSWGLKQPAGPGTVKVRSLDEWLDLFLTRPEDEWARYDNEELDVIQVADTVVESLGFTPTVAYRSN
jgi:hypothetical protein